MPVSPVFFSYPAGPNLYAAAVHLDGTVIGDPALVPGLAAAHANEIIEMFGSGLAAAPAGTIVMPSLLTDPVTVSSGKYNLTVLGAALVEAGEFQVNVQLPPDIQPGTYPLTLTVPTGSTSGSGVTVMLVVQ